MMRRAARAPESRISESDNNRFTVAEQLEQRILTGRLRPGERLPEMVLAKELGISQTSVREALQELEARGLVSKYPNRGSFVTEIDAVLLLHIFQVRRELEPLACSLLAGHLERATLDALNQCIRRMKTASERGDYPMFLEADLRFHRLIRAAQPNRILEKSLLAACLPLFAYDLIRRFQTRYSNFDRAIRQHQMMLTILQTGDGERAARVVRRLLDRWFKEILTDFALTDADQREVESKTERRQRPKIPKE